MSNPITKDAVLNAIDTATGIANAAAGDFGDDRTGLVAVAYSNLAIAYALLYQAEKQDKLIWKLEQVIDGDKSVTTYLANR